MDPAHRLALLNRHLFTHALGMSQSLSDLDVMSVQATGDRVDDPAMLATALGTLTCIGQGTGQTLLHATALEDVEVLGTLVQVIGIPVQRVADHTLEALAYQCLALFLGGSQYLGVRVVDLRCVALGEQGLTVLEQLFLGFLLHGTVHLQHEGHPVTTISTLQLGRQDVGDPLLVRLVGIGQGVQRSQLIDQRTYPIQLGIRNAVCILGAQHAGDVVRVEHQVVDRRLAGGHVLAQSLGTTQVHRGMRRGLELLAQFSDPLLQAAIGTQQVLQLLQRVAVIQQRSQVSTQQQSHGVLVLGSQVFAFVGEALQGGITSPVDQVLTFLLVALGEVEQGQHDLVRPFHLVEHASHQTLTTLEQTVTQLVTGIHHRFQTVIGSQAGHSTHQTNTTDLRVSHHVRLGRLIDHVLGLALNTG